MKRNRTISKPFIRSRSIARLIKKSPRRSPRRSPRKIPRKSPGKFKYQRSPRKLKTLKCLRKDAPLEYNKDCKNGECSLPNQIIKGLYLGGTCSRHPDVLRYLGIKNILSVNSEEKAYLKGEFNNMKLGWDDSLNQKLFPQIDKAYRFIDSKLKKGEKVLVNCFAGISRSASAVIYYIMKKFKFSYDEAFILVKSKRRIVQPNPGFEKQLREYDKKRLKVSKRSRSR